MLTNGMRQTCTYIIPNSILYVLRKGFVCQGIPVTNTSLHSLLFSNTKYHTQYYTDVNLHNELKECGVNAGRQKVEDSDTSKQFKTNGDSFVPNKWNQY
jgi:hypothetical protein